MLNKFLSLEKYSVLTIISMLMFTEITPWSGGRRWPRLFNFAPVVGLTITADLFPHRSNEMLRAEFYYKINTELETGELLS